MSILLPKPHLGRKKSDEEKRKIGLAQLGKKNAQWVSKNPSYGSVHLWLSKHFEKLKECEFCGSNKFIEWALKKKRKHDHKRENYLCLCSSCHKKYDYTKERREKLRASLKLIPHTKEWNDKVAKANIGRRHTEEAKKKMSEYRKKHPRKRNKKTGRFLKT